MSVFVTMRVPGDTQQFRQFVASEAARLEAVRDAAKAAGCLHHRFGVGQDYVQVFDEWASAEAFQRFFADPQVAQLMSESGAQGEPQISITEPIQSADQF
jgi:quinol monooxygenase YgiN